MGVMTKKALKVGNKYKCKIGAEYQLVVLTDKREDLPEKTDVIVRTGAGNLIYRSPGSLKNP